MRHPTAPDWMRRTDERMDGRWTGTWKLVYGACKMRTDAGLLNVAAESEPVTPAVSAVNY